MVLFLYASSFATAWSLPQSSDPPGYSQFPCGYYKDCAQNVAINGTAYSIHYNIIGEPYGNPEGVKVVNMTVNAELRAISMQIETRQNGTLRVDIPLNALEALGLGKDADLVMLADGKRINVGRGMDEQVVTLGGDFTRGTREILIGNPQIIPEFGNVVFLVSSVAIVGALVASRKCFRI